MNNRYYAEEQPNQETYKHALRQVQAKLGFQQHLIAYLVGTVLLLAIYLLTTLMPGFTNYPWFIWPVAGWGVALLLHFLEVFVFNESRAATRRRQMIDREMRRLNGR
jgi:uncharacterized membrane protein YdcZ (DUF606 family)